MGFGIPLEMWRGEHGCLYWELVGLEGQVSYLVKTVEQFLAIISIFKFQRVRGIKEGGGLCMKSLSEWDRPRYKEILIVFLLDCICKPGLNENCLKV